MISPVEEHRLCACGLPMKRVSGAKRYYICVNCDTVQPVEYEEDGKRQTTVYDRRFELAWKRQAREFYGNGNGRAAA